MSSKFFVSVLLAVIATPSVAASSSSSESSPLPRGCVATNFAFQHSQLALGKAGDKKQRLYLIENDLPNIVWVNHTARNAVRDSGWSTQVSTSRWTAIAIEQGSYQLSCIEAQPGAEQYIPCAKALRVCEMAEANFSAEAKGSYLVAADKKLGDILYVIKQRGIDVSIG